MPIFGHTSADYDGDSEYHGANGQHPNSVVFIGGESQNYADYGENGDETWPG